MLDDGQDKLKAWIGDTTGTRVATGTIKVHDDGSGINPDTLRLTASHTTLPAVPFGLSGDGACDAKHNTTANEGRICPQVAIFHATDGAPLQLDENRHRSHPALFTRTVG